MVDESRLDDLGNQIDDEHRAARYDESGLESLGNEIDRAARGRGGRHRPTRKKRIRRYVLAGLAVLLVFVLAGAGYLYYELHNLHRVHVYGLHSSFNAGKEVGTENILMLGSTSRCALTVQNPAYGLCSQGVNGVNSDVIMILHANPAKHYLSLLSLPRDLFVPNARTTGANKIDAGLYQGISQVVASVEQDFGIPIQHAVSLNFDQFANIVDALGGINMKFPESLFDDKSGLNVRAAACVHLNGTQALQVVRARHLQYDPPSDTSTYAPGWPNEQLSDLARIRRDHEFLRVLASAVAKTNLADPITDLNLINSVKGDLTFDQSWSVSDMVHLVLDFHSVKINHVPQLTLPVSAVSDPAGPSGSYMYKGGGPYGDVVFPSEAQDQAAINRVLGIDNSTDSMTGQPLPSPSSVTVSVMNGSGVANQATTTSQGLAALGFKIAGVGDVPTVGDVAETVVYYGSLSPAVEAAAETVARSMSGAVIMGYAPSEVTSGTQVTVVTGTDFAVNAPAVAPAPPGSGTTGSAPPSSAVTTTTVPTNSTGSTDVQPPSPAKNPLKPYDPRACAPGATPTAPVPNQT